MAEKNGLYIPDENTYSRVFERVSGGVSRLKVPNGWIVVVEGPSGHTFMLPDVTHSWKLSEATDSKVG